MKGKGNRRKQTSFTRICGFYFFTEIITNTYTINNISRNTFFQRKLFQSIQVLFVQKLLIKTDANLHPLNQVKQ